MIYTYIRKSQYIELYEKLIYYLKMENIKYNFDDDEIRLIIRNIKRIFIELDI